MHAKMKEVTRKDKTCSSANCIEANDGTVIMEKEKLLERWKEYIIDRNLSLGSYNYKSRKRIEGILSCSAFTLSLTILPDN